MRRLLAVLALAAGFALVLAAAAVARPSDEAKPAVFTDPTGDAGTAADLATVTVTNDFSGLYSFDIEFATPLVATSQMFLYLDTDLNTSTGSPKSLGADYALGDYEADKSWTFFKWDGSEWADAPSTSSIKVFVAGDSKTLTFSINKSDIDASAGFNFFVVSEEGDGTDGHYDDAPSGEGSWQYKEQPRVTISLVAAKAYAARAGGKWTMALVARRSDTGETLGGEGAITCSASSGPTKLVIYARAFVSAGAGAGSGAVCSFVVPKRLKHKVVHGTITVTYLGKAITRSFTQTVK